MLPEVQINSFSDTNIILVELKKKFTRLKKEIFFQRFQTPFEHL